MKFENLFNLENLKKGNTLVSGANSSGKTLACCGLASVLKRIGIVQVIDVSGVWKHKSDLEHYTKIYDIEGELTYAKLPRSGIYDLSLLTLPQIKEAIETICLEIWLSRINLTFNTPLWIFIEEAEIPYRNVRYSPNAFRLLHVGRNISVRQVMISTDLSLIDTTAIRLSTQRLQGFITPEESQVRKMRTMYGKDNTRIMLEGLECGDFIRYRHRKPLDVVSLPEFKSKNAPKLWLKFEPTEPEPQPKLNAIQKLRLATQNL